MVSRHASRKLPKNLSLPKRFTRKRSGFRPQVYLPKASLHPGTDFYTYVNHDWLQKTKIPPTQVSYGVSEEIEKDLQTKLLSLLDVCTPSSQDPVERTLGVFLHSILDPNAPSQTLRTLQAILASIQTLSSKEEVAVIQGEFARYQIQGLLAISGQYETRGDTKVYTLRLSPGSLGLPDSSFYFQGTLGRSHHLAQYKKLLRRIGARLGLSHYSCVVKLERILAGVLSMTGLDMIHTQIKGKELETKYPHVPWEHLFKAYGLESWRSRVLCLESPRWISTLNKFYAHLGLDYWRLFLSHQIIMTALPWLPSPYPSLFFRFYRTELRGQPHPLSPRLKALALLQYRTTPFLSRLFRNHLVDPRIKAQANTLVQDLLSSAKQYLSNLRWMEPATKENAKKKLAAMSVQVGYPETQESLACPPLDSTNLLANLLTLGEVQTKRELDRLGQPLSKRTEWADAIFAVNAYYYQEANEIVIPYGILSFPFFDPKASAAWNYGALGCVLGHEITHAFDQEGKNYDPKGHQKRWWTSKDNRAYNASAKALVDFYSQQTLEGIPIQGKKTLSENIADLGGMAIALEALKTYLGKTPLTQKEREQAFREFFVSYATSWRVKERHQSLIQSILVSRHAPAPLRVNLIVSQFQEWYDAFGILPEDRLYLPPEKRIHSL